MQRQILAQAAWRAIAAVAGFFTLTFAYASPVDLWNLTVKSRQGEPFVARVKIVFLPSERISARCLSMGPQSDAPGLEMPFLSQATLKLDAARNVVTISTSAPVVSPGVELILRVKCQDAPLYARHFTALIPPATSKAARARVAAAAAKASNVAKAAPAASSSAPAAEASNQETPVAQDSATSKSAAGPPDKSQGFRLKLLPGDSVESIAAVLFPGQRAQQQALVQQVLAGNPLVFTDASNREVSAGTVLWFPDLAALRKSVRATKPRPDRVATRGSPGTPTRAPKADGSPQGGPVTLRRALELGDRPGPQECRQLMDLCGAPASAAAPIADGKVTALESGMQQLHLKQDGIDQQLQRLEKSLVALQNTVNTLPAHIAPAPSLPAPPPAAPVPPRVEIRTVVQPAPPVEWYIWLALAGIVIAVGLIGFAYGRKGSFSRGLQETDDQLDRMLASGSADSDEQLKRMMAGAADVMREFEANPIRVASPPATEFPAPPRPPVQRPVAPRPAPPPPALALPELPPMTISLPAEPEPLVLSPPGTEPLQMTDIATEPRVESPPVVDTPARSDAPAPQIAGLSNEILFEMDQALDNTRSMFTDVDRFIALGRTQNALSLLQFQVHKDPTDRDSWIKLLAIYRQEKMDVELTKAAREFRSNFPNENPPV